MDLKDLLVVALAFLLAIVINSYTGLSHML